MKIWKLNLNLSFFKKRIELFSFICLIGIWGLALLNYSALPDYIAIHYDASGKPDRIGRKSNIFNIPVIVTFLYIGLIYIDKRMKKYFDKTNSKLTYEKYKSVIEMISVLNLSLVLSFGILLIRKIQVEKNNTDELGVWFYYLVSE
jgi:uncharacterized membrane protein